MNGGGKRCQVDGGEIDQSGEAGGGGFALGDVQHGLGDIRGGDADAAASEPDGVFAGAAAQFENVIAGAERGGQVRLHGLPQPASQLGFGEVGVVAGGSDIKWLSHGHDTMCAVSNLLIRFSWRFPSHGQLRPEFCIEFAVQQFDELIFGWS